MGVCVKVICLFTKKKLSDPQLQPKAYLLVQHCLMKKKVARICGNMPVLRCKHQAVKLRVEAAAYLICKNRYTLAHQLNVCHGF